MDTYTYAPHEENCLNDRHEFEVIKAISVPTDDYLLNQCKHCKSTEWRKADRRTYLKEKKKLERR